MSATLVIYILSEQDCAVLTWAPTVILGPLRVGLGVNLLICPIGILIKCRQIDLLTIAKTRYLAIPSRVTFQSKPIA